MVLIYFRITHFYNAKNEAGQPWIRLGYCTKYWFVRPRVFRSRQALPMRISSLQSALLWPRKRLREVEGVVLDGKMIPSYLQMTCRSTNSDPLRFKMQAGNMSIKLGISVGRPQKYHIERVSQIASNYMNVLNS